MYLKNATLDDMDFIYQVRNDETSRKNSINKDIIAYDSHCIWYKNKINSSDTDIFVLINEGKRVGHVMLEKEDEIHIKISYYVAPECRGKGYGNRIIELVEKHFLKQNKKIILQAEVLKDNEISKKIFKKQKYMQVAETESIVAYAKEIGGVKIV